MSDTCRNGHPWTPESTYVRPDRTRGRECRICRTEREVRGPLRPGMLLRGEADDVAVDRAVFGDLNGTVLNVPEREEAVRRLTADGMSARAIARRVGCTCRTVHRIRTRLRENTP